jgi:hypothetical protein
MRHIRIDNAPRLEGTAIAAVWPRLEEALAPAEAEGEAAPAPAPASAAPDVPAAVGGLVVGSYAALIGVFFAFFARSPVALFSIVICAFFAAMFFAVPRIFLAVEADPARRPSLAEFRYKGMDILTGHSGGRDAIVQMIVVPVLLTLGLAAMGIIGLVYIG